MVIFARKIGDDGSARMTPYTTINYYIGVDLMVGLTLPFDTMIQKMMAQNAKKI